MSDSAIDFAIATLEAAAAELRRQRDQQAAISADEAPDHPSPIDATADDDADDAFPADDFLETWAASERFGVAADTLRYWARRHGTGKKVGGRWLISISRTEALCGPG